MTLAGIAANSGFSAREIENFTVQQARFWWNALAEYDKRASKAR